MNTLHRYSIYYGPTYLLHVHLKPFFQLCEDKVKDSILEELKAKDEVIYNIGAKFLKIKSSKMFFQKKLENLQVQNKKVSTNQATVSTFSYTTVFYSKPHAHSRYLLVPPTHR